MFGLRKKAKKIGLAFGGGGARGLAHLGVIRAFQEAGINADMVAGCSAGSVAAAAYCSGMSYEQMYDRAKKLKKEDFFTSKIFFVPSDSKRIEETMKKILGEHCDFENCVTPLAILAVDIVSGQEYVFENKGSIPHAISASCAVPGVLTPVIEHGKILMDGSLMNTVPATVLRDRGCDVVISVAVGDLSTPVAKSSGLIDVISASVKIMVRSNSLKGKNASDIVIEPDLHGAKFNSLENVDSMIDAGYRAAMVKMPMIKELVR